MLAILMASARGGQERPREARGPVARRTGIKTSDKEVRGSIAGGMPDRGCGDPRGHRARGSVWDSENSKDVQRKVQPCFPGDPAEDARETKHGGV